MPFSRPSAADDVTSAASMGVCNEAKYATENGGFAAGKKKRNVCGRSATEQ